MLRAATQVKPTGYGNDTRKDRAVSCLLIRAWIALRKRSYAPTHDIYANICQRAHTASQPRNVVGLLTDDVTRWIV